MNKDTIKSYKEWREIGEQVQLFGKPTTEMDREELLVVIGCLSKQITEGHPPLFPRGEILPRMPLPVMDAN